MPFLHARLVVLDRDAPERGAAVEVGLRLLDRFRARGARVMNSHNEPTLPTWMAGKGFFFWHPLAPKAPVPSRLGFHPRSSYGPGSYSITVPLWDYSAPNVEATDQATALLQELFPAFLDERPVQFATICGCNDGPRLAEAKDGVFPRVMAWWTYYDQATADLVGAEKLLALPLHRRERLGKGVNIQVTERLTDPMPAFEPVRDLLALKRFRFAFGVEDKVKD